MHYTDFKYDKKSDYKSDNLVLYDSKHDKKPKYSTENIKLKDYQYKSNTDFEQELYNIKEETLYVKPIILEYKIEFASSMHNPIQQFYAEEKYKQKQYGDIEFYEWLYAQKDENLAVFAEIINAPKLNSKIEKMREKVALLETVSILNFAKHKKLGSKQIHFIKKIKEKYGNYILKFLKLYC
jgi:hypothetical protein